jgi:hypothetical protein
MAKNKTQINSMTGLMERIATAPIGSFAVAPSKSPVEGMTREEFFIVFSGFIARGNTPDAAYKLTRQYMPKVLRAIENGN